MTTLEGHLTSSEKKHIKLIMSEGLTSGQVNKKTYVILEENGVYTVKITQIDRGLGSVGSQLRRSTYLHKFKM